MDKETRISSIKASTETSENLVEGYALKFNTLSEDLGGFKEVILQNALSETDMTDIRCFLDHDTSKILGRTISNTLNIEVDEIGLKIKCALPNNTLGNDTFESIRRGDLSQMSFAFILGNNGDNFEHTENGYIRKIHNIKKITEVSIVSIPAYSETDIAVAQRNLHNSIAKAKDELILRLQLSKKY